MSTDCLAAWQAASRLDEHDLLVQRRTTAHRDRFEQKNQKQTRLTGCCYALPLAVMEHCKKVLTLPDILHIMRCTQIVW
ncbi:MAG TPA: hypothetical protein VI542_09020 [Candidatus Tectomicrobia bacterium]